MPILTPAPLGPRMRLAFIGMRQRNWFSGSARRRGKSRPAALSSSSPVTQIAQNGVFERFARAGYVVSGLLHLIIGYLAIRIALGSGGSADQSGALAALAANPGGIVALWVAVVALVVMGLWRLVETALGRSTDPKSQGASSEVLDRAKAFALAVVYFALAYSA